MATALIDTIPRGFGVFDRADELDSAHHEQVIFCRDTASGLRAIISIHDTTLGSALGGTRFYPYESEAAALTDGLRLSQGMTYKAAAANLPLGGGKAVIIGDPSTHKSPELLRAYGRFVETLNGRYITAADVGTTSDDLDIIGQTTNHVVGRNTAAGGSGDSGFSTAFGVFCSMRAGAEFLWGDDGLNGRTVGVEGAGKVGFHLIGLLIDAGASVVLTDPQSASTNRVLDTYRDVTIASSVVDADVDVYAPCALGGTLSEYSLGSLKAKLVCGAANNQLAEQSIDSALTAREILWVPDFIANAGGLIQVAGERDRKEAEAVRADIGLIANTVTEVLDAARAAHTPTGAASLKVVTARLAAAKAENAS